MDTQLGMREEVVLLDEAGQPIGTADKATVHTTETPLHLAFSCYVFDDAGQPAREPAGPVQAHLARACGPTPSAATRPPARTWPTPCGAGLLSELGLDIREVRPYLPDFRYRAVMDNGIVENEVCPVFRTEVPSGTVPMPDPEEVEDYRWIPWSEFSADVLSGAFEVSPWCKLQVEELARRGQA